MEYHSLAPRKMLLVLKFSIHCEDCKSKLLRGKAKLKRRLELMEGVDSVEIDSELWIAVIKGRVDHRSVISMLKEKNIEADILLFERVPSMIQESQVIARLEEEILRLSAINGVKDNLMTETEDVPGETQESNDLVFIPQPEISSSPAAMVDQYPNSQQPSWPGGITPTAPPVPPDYVLSPPRSYFPPPPPPPPPTRFHPHPHPTPPPPPRQSPLPPSPPPPPPPQPPIRSPPLPSLSRHPPPPPPPPRRNHIPTSSPRQCPPPPPPPPPTRNPIPTPSPIQYPPPPPPPPSPIDRPIPSPPPPPSRFYHIPTSAPRHYPPPPPPPPPPSHIDRPPPSPPPRPPSEITIFSDHYTGDCIIM